MPVRVEPVRPKQLGHPFRVPARDFDVGKGKHEAVGHFVQHEMAAVIVRLLLVDPEFGPPMAAIEKGRQVVGEQPRAPEERLVGHYVPGDLELGVLRIGGQGTEILAQRRIERIDSRKQ